jgi:hypothetical protein
MSGNALPRPLEGGRGEGFLGRIFGGVEMPVPPHDRAEDLWREGAQ